MDRNKPKNRLMFWYLIAWIFLFIALYLSYAVYFVDLGSTKSKWVALFAGAIGVLLASCKVYEVSLNYTRELDKVMNFLLKGFIIFTYRRTKVLLPIIIFALFLTYRYLGKGPFVCFLAGILMQKFIVLVCTLTAKLATPGVFKSVNDSINSAFKNAFNSGVIISFIAVSAAIAPLVILYHAFKDFQVISLFALGAMFCPFYNSAVSSVAKIASNNSGRIVSQIENNLTFPDKRNPVTLINDVSDGILSLNKTTNDLYTTYIIVMVSSIAMGAMCLNIMGSFLPLIIGATGIFACVISVLLLKFNKVKNPIKTLFLAVLFSIAAASAVDICLVKIWLPDGCGLAFSAITGMLCGYVVCFLSSGVIFEKYRPVRNVVNASMADISATFIQIIKESFKNSFAPVLLLALCVIVSFLLSYGLEAPLLGLYGITLAGVGMVSVASIILSINSFAYILNNVNIASGNLEEEISAKTHDRISVLDKTAFQSSALNRSYINFSGIFCSVSAFITYTVCAEFEEIDMLNPVVICVLLLGAVLPFLYGSFVLSCCSRCASKLVFEIKKQLRKFPQIIKYEMRPDYEKCCELTADYSAVGMIYYSIIIFIIFALIFAKLKTEILGGFLFAIIVVSAVLIFAFSNVKHLSACARRYFLSSYQNAVKTPEYYNLDSAKNTMDELGELMAPSLLSLIKFLTILALCLVPLFVQY